MSEKGGKLYQNMLLLQNFISWEGLQNREKLERCPNSYFNERKYTTNQEESLFVSKQA